METVSLDVYYQALTVLSEIKAELIEHLGDFFAKHTSRRAKKDRQDRERTIKKVREMLERPSAIKQSVKRRKNQYLDININTETACLDEQRIESQAQFDGY